MSDLSIRIEEPGDAGGVRETNEQAFGEPLEARLVDALRGSADSISLVAAIDACVVGHILFTPVTIEPPVDRHREQLDSLLNARDLKVASIQKYFERERSAETTTFNSAA